MRVIAQSLAVLGICAAAIIAASPGLAGAQTAASPDAAPPAPTVLVPSAPSASPLTAPAPAMPPAAVVPGAPAAPAPQGRPAPIIEPAEQVRGFSCFTGGLFAAAGVWAFSEFVMVAGAGGAGWPVVLPLMAAAFVTGCSIGSETLPAFYALIR